MEVQRLLMSMFLFSDAQWMKEESNSCQIIVLTQESQRMANVLAQTSGNVMPLQFKLRSFFQLQQSCFFSILLSQRKYAAVVNDENRSI